jgi:hypothetical protein
MMGWFKKKDPVMEKATKVQGRKVFVNDNDPRRKYKRNLARIKRLKNRLSEISSDHPQRESIRLELKRRLTFVEEYEHKHGIGGEQ